ncbi:hypothetical protein M422DRAFT_63684 [Sphaerobolus stellatus SS14]|nr:hypothetical protein M422DRAFT_63684 [Sphaerobolus stellatus SS14]
MPVNKAAENVLGTIGTICWTAQILPQNWKSWREHSTEGLSTYLVFLWSLATIFLGVYTVAQKINIPLMIQPQVFGFFSALSWTQCLYYSHKKSFMFCVITLISFVIIGGGFEAGMVFALRHGMDKGNIRPVQFFGIFSSVLIAIGLLPQYWEIWKRKEVVGVSYFFIIVDTLGGVFSLLSLIYKPDLDIIAAITYSLVIVMDSVIIVAAIILNPRASRRRRLLQENNSATLGDQTNDEIESKPDEKTPELSRTGDVEKQDVKAPEDGRGETVSDIERQILRAP